VTNLDRATRRSALAFRARLDEIKDQFVARDEVVDLLGIGALCREHVLVIGPPGTAKTRLLNRFCQMLDTTPFTYLLTRFTEPAEIFGPIDVRKFQDEKIFELNTEGMLPNARIAFLDEVFQGSSAILNTLLTLINERTFHNGRTQLRTPLITLVGSSNDIPDDPVLAAFSDRFLLRCDLDYVGRDQVGRVLEIGWEAEQELIQSFRTHDDGRAGQVLQVEDQSEVRISGQELTALQAAIGNVDMSPLQAPYIEIIQALHEEGVTFSDRRAVKAQKVFAASAVLAGRGEAELSDLARLVNLWSDRRDAESLRRIVADHGVPVDDPGHRVREVHEILEVDLHDIMVRRNQVTTEPEFRALMHRGQLLAAELRRDHPDSREALERAEREQRETVTMFLERFPGRGLG
jgi:MoxR-like ATPase